MQNTQSSFPKEKRKGRESSMPFVRWIFFVDSCRASTVFLRVLRRFSEPLKTQKCFKFQFYLERDPAEWKLTRTDVAFLCTEIFLYDKAITETISMFQAIFTYVYNIYIYFMVMLDAAKATNLQITSSCKTVSGGTGILNILVTSSRMSWSIIRFCLLI